MNNKGFTLVELLATMAILAVLMLLAIPNVIGVVQRNKNKTYVEDAKKLVTLAEYKIRSNPNEVKPKTGQSYCYYMDYLDKSKELDDSPNGGAYDRYLSYVKATNNNGTITYKVQLTEIKAGTKMGIKEADSQALYKDDATSKLTGTPSSKCSSASSKYFYDKDGNPYKTQLTKSPTASSTVNPYS